MAILTVDIGGVPHYYHSSVPMEANTSDDRVLGTVVTVTNTAGAVLTPMDVDTLSPLSPFQSSPINGVVPPCYLPALVANYDAGGDAQYSSKSPYLEDLAELAPAAIAAAEAANLISAEAAAEASASRADAQAAAAEVDALSSDFEDALSNATAGAVRTVGGGRDPIYAMYDDETIPAGLPEGALIMVRYRTAPA